MTISALCIFSGDFEGSNANAAAEALRVAGYQVFRLAPARKAKLIVEGDDFIEVHREGADDYDSLAAMMDDVERIVAPFEGDVDCVGAAAKEPFDDLFGKSS